MTIDPRLIPAVRASAARLGISPIDLLTAMSYETGGKLDPNLWGGAGNRYLGLIQFGPQEQKTYGVKPDMPVADQVTAAERFLRDRGVKPGMGNCGHLLDDQRRRAAALQPERRGKWLACPAPWPTR